jgi:phosphoenolpyruvate carboxylase
MLSFNFKAMLELFAARQPFFNTEIHDLKIIVSKIHLIFSPRYVKRLSSIMTDFSVDRGKLHYALISKFGETRAEQAGCRCQSNDSLPRNVSRIQF